MVRIMVTATKNGYTDTIVDEFRKEDDIPIYKFIKWLEENRNGWHYVIEISNYG